AAQDFIDAYYPALNNPKARSSIADFYVKPIPGSPLKADIVLNGTAYSDPKEVQKLFETDVAAAHYEVQAFDFQTVNSNFNVGASEAALAPDMDGKKISVVVMVSGIIRYGEAGDVRGFTDNVVLVPNWDSHSPKAPKGLKRWLVQAQTFRLVF
ncbi:uncharacterized protein LY89DRAFT_588247, partial [Mollisia scopiformis]